MSNINNMSKQNSIEVIVDGIRCYWSIMAAFGNTGEKKLVCSRYSCGDFTTEYNKKVEQHVPVPKPGLTNAEIEAIDTMAFVFGFDEDEVHQIRKLAEDIKWQKSAHEMLRKLAEEDETSVTQP